MVEQPAQQLDHHHFEDAVGQKALAAARLVGFGEQQFQRQLQARHPRQRQHDQRRQCACQRVARTAVEIQPRAGEVGALRRGILEAVGQRARIQQQRRLVQMQGPWQFLRVRVADLQVAVAQHVQVAVSIAGIEVLDPAQPAGVVQFGADSEPFEDAGETVDGRIGTHLH